MILLDKRVFWRISSELLFDISKINSSNYAIYIKPVPSGSNYLHEMLKSSKSFALIGNCYSKDELSNPSRMIAMNKLRKINVTTISKLM